MNSENLLDMFQLLHVSLGTINARSGLFVNCIWIAEMFHQNSCDGGLLNPTRPLPIFHHRPSYSQKAKSKLSPMKNLHDRHVRTQQPLKCSHIHMPCINVPQITMGNTLHGFDCI